MEISCTVYAILEQCFPKFIPQGPGDNGRFKKVMTQNTPEQSKNMLIFSSQPQPQVDRYFGKRSSSVHKKAVFRVTEYEAFRKHAPWRTRVSENIVDLRVSIAVFVWCACDGTPFITAGNQVQFYAVISYR